MMTNKESDFEYLTAVIRGGQVQASYILKVETVGFSEMLINFCQVDAGRHFPEESIIQVMY
jgi:hypothetical protein